MRAEVRGASAIPAMQGTEGTLADVGRPAMRSPFRKICGISLEAHAGGVCVGTGVNVVPPEGRPSVGGKNTPAYLADLAPRFAVLPQREALDGVFDAVAVQLAACYERWLAQGFDSFADELNAVSSLRNRSVSLVDRKGAEVASGMAVRIDGQGCLVVRDGFGCETAVSSGEVHLV